MRNVTRRMMLAGLLGSAATGALGQGLVTSPRPRARPMTSGRIRPVARPSLADTIARAALGGAVGVVLADAQTGEVLDSHLPDTAVPPASVTKAVTAVYALEALGPDHRFVTRLLATAPVVDGILDGDLILAGGGDPNLVTDDLAALAQRMHDAGLREVRGQFLVYGAALPNLDELDQSQLDHLGYNPAISGLNLNFNRVHFEWKRQSGNYTVTMDARSKTYRPAVTVSKMRIVDRDLPIYAYREVSERDEWSVARRALGAAGSRWLPVRQPEIYAGEVFATFARSHGVVLPRPKEVLTLPQTQEVARFESAALVQMMQAMLRFSTNLTAEVAGMAATQKRAGGMRGLRTSALAFSGWVRARTGGAPVFADHSGLLDSTRVSASQIVTLLQRPEVQAMLRPILKQHTFVNEKGRALADQPGLIVAKTGTLNFVTTLAGYITTVGGRELIFAIFAADLEAREKGKAAGDEQPFGSISFNTKAKALQQQLLRRWVQTP